jgi:hypothetical protein
MTVSDEELDRAIDDVAREMMRADASADLRARVVARLSDAHAAGSFLSARLAWGSALAVMALIAIAVLLMRPTPESPANAPTRLAASNTATSPIVEPDRHRPAMDTRGEMPTPVRHRATRTDTARPGLAWDAGPAPLPHPDPIAIDTLAPQALAVPGFDVAPLNDIQPITIPAAGSALPEPQRREPR